VPPTALSQWRSSGLARLAELEVVDANLTGTGPGRRWGTTQLNRSLFLALVAQVQRYCRDLHDDAVVYRMSARRASGDRANTGHCASSFSSYLGTVICLVGVASTCSHHEADRNRRSPPRECSTASGGQESSCGPHGRPPPGEDLRVLAHIEFFYRLFYREVWYWVLRRGTVWHAGSEKPQLTGTKWYGKGRAG
jgi:hypothetical protein